MKQRVRKKQEFTWAKVAAILIVLAVAGYQWYQNNRQAAQSQNDLGSVVQSDKSVPAANDKYRTKIQPKPTSKNSKSETASKSQPDLEDLTGFDLETGDSTEMDSWKVDSQSKGTKATKGIDGTKETKETAPENPESVSDSFLQPAGGRNLKSPAGLLYYVGPGGENRVEHVMRHSRDDPDRPSHGVFDGDQDTILKLLDEAYGMIKAKSKSVKTEASQGNTAYTVSLGRRIGYEGGEKGDRSGNRPLKSLRLILNGNQVITAYPYR